MAKLADVAMLLIIITVCKQLSPLINSVSKFTFEFALKTGEPPLL